MLVRITNVLQMAFIKAHLSWFNMAEIELFQLNKQYLCDSFVFARQCCLFLILPVQTLCTGRVFIKIHKLCQYLNNTKLDKNEAPHFQVTLFQSLYSGHIRVKWKMYTSYLLLCFSFSRSLSFLWSLCLCSLSLCLSLCLWESVIQRRNQLVEQHKNISRKNIVLPIVYSKSGLKIWTCFAFIWARKLFSHNLVISSPRC